jgi:hypothetical protein
LMDASTLRFVEALLTPPPRDNWSRKLNATPLRTRANRSAAFLESPETRVRSTNKKRERGATIETLADDLINLNCGTHSLGLIYEFLAKQLGEARGREEFIKYLSGEWSRDWVQAAAAATSREDATRQDHSRQSCTRCRGRNMAHATEGLLRKALDAPRKANKTHPSRRPYLAFARAQEGSADGRAHEPHPAPWDTETRQS